MANIKRYKKGQAVKLTTNFWSTEFDSKGGHSDEEWTLIDLDHVKKLQELRDELNKLKRKKVFVRITSGYRSPTQNKAVGGVSRSRHVVGDATDIVVEGVLPNEVADLAEVLGFNGIGRYDTFTHVDSRPYKARWDFRKKK
jgi:uncharacterized protein YcbK (DUF882 family)